jgi:hypothetical protein
LRRRTPGSKSFWQRPRLIKPCSSCMPGEAVGASCAVRRSLWCDGKLLSPEHLRRAVVILQERTGRSPSCGVVYARSPLTTFAGAVGWPTGCSEWRSGQ